MDANLRTMFRAERQLVAGFKVLVAGQQGAVQPGAAGSIGKNPMLALVINDLGVMIVHFTIHDDIEKDSAIWCRADPPPVAAQFDDFTIAGAVKKFDRKIGRRCGFCCRAAGRRVTALDFGSLPWGRLFLFIFDAFQTALKIHNTFKHAAVPTPSARWFPFQESLPAHVGATPHTNDRRAPGFRKFRQLSPQAPAGLRSI